MSLLLKIKSYIHKEWYHLKRKSLRRNIKKRYGQSDDDDVRLVMEFLDNHPKLSLPLGMSPPYEWTKEYRAEDIVVKKDQKRNLLYVAINGRKVFFPRKETLQEIQKSVRIGLMEQDARSPHSYISNKFQIDQGDIGVFIGASDGLFCLSILDRLSKAYLFEPAPHWIEPLQATFEPWCDKVEIVPLTVGRNSNNGQISLDDYFKDKTPPNFIQVDVDGGDWDVLQGALSILEKANKIRLSHCTYHKRLDFPRFSSYLKKLGYEINHSPGYFLIGVRMPYLRRGVLYASKLK